mmetsp:Transcript_24924/g.69025  ORF Transcript_24924/g.69025 Transcript_24924/m.69025 type:complete len:201 (-) Transcript_24924:589-1191(-)
MLVNSFVDCFSSDFFAGFSALLLESFGSSISILTASFGITARFLSPSLFCPRESPLIDGPTFAAESLTCSSALPEVAFCEDARCSLWDVGSFSKISRAAPFLEGSIFPMEAPPSFSSGDPVCFVGRSGFDFPFCIGDLILPDSDGFGDTIGDFLIPGFGFKTLTDSSDPWLLLDSGLSGIGFLGLLDFFPLDGVGGFARQ